MRKDALGLFWKDEPVIKVTKEKIKRTPPDPIWLRPDYLPNLDEAMKFEIKLLSNEELASLATLGLLKENKDTFIFDLETYENYFVVGFKSLKTNKIVYIELFEGGVLDTAKLDWILRTFRLVGFNSLNFDLPILAMALAGATVAQMKDAARRIIEMGENYRDVLKRYRVKALKDLDHIDLIEVAPLRASLKIYAGRMHAPRMQDLPFHPDAILSEPQIEIVRWYLVNDLENTQILSEGLEEQIKLRETMGHQYNMDLRSKSDAQIAEYVLSAEVAHLNGKRIARPTIPPGTCYRYRVPPFLQYRTDLLQWALNIVANAPFIVADHGSIEMPKRVEELKLDINGSIYRMGIGGLHSSESKVAHVADENYKLFDFDVTSYYPIIIRNQGLFPYHMGQNFLRVYNGIIETRIAAKKRGDKVAANSLKIVVNGSYGKLGSKYSNLYAPDLLIQVTLTGQLALLMLIERLELAGIKVVSANTDGIVVKPHVSQIDAMRAIVKAWEKDTDFTMEDTEYRGLFSRDVNNYIAVKLDGKTKTKGAYANPWNDPSDRSMWMHKNPTNTICVEAVEALLTKGVPLVNTILECQDVRKFVTIRTVKSGAVKDGVYLGKSIRWYYAKGEEGEMVIANSGNKVPRSDGARPLMQLPERLPEDVDHEWYIQEAEKILKEIAYV